MAEVNRLDPLVSTEPAVEVDSKTAESIEQGIRAAEQGKTVSSDEARRLVSQWISKYATPIQP